jgi:N-acetylneuraminic acid mutarotase
VTVQNGKIFVIGGYLYTSGATAGPFNTVEVYDIGTNTWSTAAPMPTAREGLLAATVGDKIFAIGGLTVAARVGTPTGVVERYNVVTNTWDTGFTPMPTPRGIVFGGVACGNNPVFVIGGTSAGGLATSKNEAYIPSHDAWITRADMPGTRAEAGAAVVGSEIHAIGGFTITPGVFDTNINQAYHCANGVGGRVTDPRTGLAVGGLSVGLLDSTGTLLASALTGNTGFYYIDVTAPGTYTLSVTTLSGTTTSTVNVPAGSIITQDLAR